MRSQSPRLSPWFSAAVTSPRHVHAMSLEQRFRSMVAREQGGMANPHAWRTLPPGWEVDRFHEHDQLVAGWGAVCPAGQASGERFTRQWQAIRWAWVLALRSVKEAA